MMAGLVSAAIGADIWIFSTFATLASVDAHASDFRYHVEATTIWQLETRLEDVSDRRSTLISDGITPKNSDYANDLEKREKKLTKQISCLQSNGKHCLSKTDSG